MPRNRARANEIHESRSERGALAAFHLSFFLSSQTFAKRCSSRPLRNSVHCSDGHPVNRAPCPKVAPEKSVSASRESFAKAAPEKSAFSAKTAPVNLAAAWKITPGRLAPAPKLAPEKSANLPKVAPERSANSPKVAPVNVAVSSKI